MRRKKTIKVGLFISILCLILSGEVVLPAYAIAENSGITEKDDGRKEEKITEEKIKDYESAVENENIAGIDVATPATPTRAERKIETESVPVRLQVPQKFDIVLDPWGMDGREQVYSEEYTIKNTGKAKGTLKLTGIAAKGEGDVNILSDSNSIYDGNDKNIFIELMINSKDRLTLLPEGSDYEIVLGADMGVTLTFTGMLNEKVEDGWSDSDIKVSVIYDWIAESGENDIEENAIWNAVKEESSEKMNIEEEDESK